MRQKRIYLFKNKKDRKDILENKKTFEENERYTKEDKTIYQSIKDSLNEFSNEFFESKKRK